MKPKRLTWSELKPMNIHEFNEYHGTDYKYWHDFLPIEEDKPIRNYMSYLDWYNKKFTKLGQSLK